MTPKGKADERPWFIWTVKELIDAITLAIKSGFGRTIFVMGQRGIGKSEGVRQAVDACGAVMVDRRLSMMDPSDVRGVLMAPMQSEPGNDLAVWLANPDFFPTLAEGQRLVLLLDEFNHATSLVQKAAYEIAWDHSIAGRKLPEGTVVILAGNSESENANVTAVDKPMRRRAIWCYLRFDFDTFWTHAMNASKESHGKTVQRFHPLVLGFLNPKGGRPDFANAPIDDEPEYFGEPLPASWEVVSDIERDYGLARPDLAEKMIAGAVGPGAAGEYIAWRATAGKLTPLIESIVNGKNDVAPEMSQQFYVAMSLVERYRHDDTLAKRIVEYAMATKDSVPEMSGLMFAGAYKANGSTLRSVKEFQKCLLHYSRYIV